METEDKEMWESPNAFAMSDIESGEEGKVHRTIEWRREEVTKLVARIDEALENGGVMENHPQEHQM